MKKTMLLLAFIATIFSATAHNLIPIAYCAISGKVTLNNTQFTIGAGKSAHFYITKNGTQTVTGSNPIIWQVTVNLSGYSTDELNDSVGAITPTGFKINVPQPTNHNGTGVTVFSTENDSYGNTVWTTATYKYTNLTNVCLALPIAFSSVSAERINDTQVRVIFVVQSVSGTNNVINIQISFDEGKTYETRAVVFPDSAVAGQVFTVVINSKQ